MLALHQPTNFRQTNNGRRQLQCLSCNVAASQTRRRVVVVVAFESRSIVISPSRSARDLHFPCAHFLCLAKPIGQDGGPIGQGKHGLNRALEFLVANRANRLLSLESRCIFVPTFVSLCGTSFWLFASKLHKARCWNASIWLGQSSKRLLKLALVCLQADKHNDFEPLAHSTELQPPRFTIDLPTSNRVRWNSSKWSSLAGWLTGWLAASHGLKQTCKYCTKDAFLVSLSNVLRATFHFYLLASFCICLLYLSAVGNKTKNNLHKF